MNPKEEKTLVLIKPDALQRNLLGEVIHRFERKGLKIIGLKMLRMDEGLLDEHYGKYKDKSFFEGLRRYITHSPIIAMVLAGHNAVRVVRNVVGPTKGHEAPAGTIRGDFSMSVQTNLVHASDPEENPEEEVQRFFNEDELFDYGRVDYDLLYGPDERGE